MTVIQARGLGKTFKVFDRRGGFWGSLRDVVDRRWRELHAVQDVDLSIGRGECVGYIGPNGAGKSTTIKMLTGILTPSRGQVTVNGFDPHRQRSQYVRTVGAVFGQRTQLWWDLAVSESFELLRHLYGVSLADYTARLKRFETVLELGEFLQTPVRKLSLGQRMKADIAASLLHAPPVVFLDEPTVGVDVITKARLRDFLRELNREEGTTILLTTHDMQDIEALCSRVVVIDHGRIMHDGNLAGLKERYGARRRLTLTLSEPVDVATRDLPRDGIAWDASEPLRLVATLESHADTPATLQRILAALPVVNLTVQEPSIEHVVHALHGDGAALAAQTATQAAVPVGAPS